MNEYNKNIKFQQSPNKEIDTQNIFGVDCSFKIFGFESKNDYVPAIDKNYQFDPQTTKSILAGFSTSSPTDLTLLFPK